jgi:hypothetical protein
MSKNAEFYADFIFFDCWFRRLRWKKVKSKSLEKSAKTSDYIICMPVAGVPRDVGLSTHGLRAGS